MSELDPSYLRSIRDGIINGNIESNNTEALPDGLVGLYDKELFSPTLNWKQRKETLHFFLVFALAQKEISADFASAILGEEWCKVLADENETTEEKRLKKVNEFIQLHSKRFTSAGEGKFRLYHERFRVYILQKVSESDLAQFNHKFIELFETALNANSKNDSPDKERYALEFLSKHIFINTLFEINSNSEQLKKYAFNKIIWKRQKEVSQSPDWTNQALNYVLQCGLKYNDNDVFSYASEKVKFIDFYTDDLGVILSSIKSGNLDKAHEGFSLLFQKGEDGLVQQMNTYIIMFVFAANSISDKIVAKQTLNTILEIFSKNIPEPIEGFFLWSDSCVPPVMVFNASIKAAEIGCDWKILWRNFNFENGNRDFFRSFNNDWILNVPLNNQFSIEIVSFILKLNSEDLEWTGVLRDKAYLRIKIAEKLLINKNEEGKVWIKDILSNVYLRSEVFEDFDEIKREVANVLVKTGNIKQALTVVNLIKDDKEMFSFVLFLVDYLLKDEETKGAEFNEIISHNTNQIFNLIFELKILFFKKEYKQVLVKFEELITLFKAKYNSGKDIKGELLPLLIKSATDLDLLNQIYRHFYKDKTDIKTEENIGISFAFLFAYINKNEQNQSLLIYETLKEIEWELFEGFNAVYLFNYVKKYLSELEEFDSELYARITTICLDFFKERPRYAKYESFFTHAKNTPLWNNLIEESAAFWVDGSLPVILTRDLSTTLTYNESELMSITNQLSVGNYYHERELSYLIPLFNDPEMVEKNILNLENLYHRNASLRNWYFFSEKYDDYEKVCPELLESILYSVEKASIDTIPQFVPVATLYTSQWQSNFELVSEFDSQSKETESIAIAMHCASKNDFKTFFDLYENETILDNRLQFNLAFLSYYNEIFTILNDKPLNEINPILIEPFTSILETMKYKSFRNANPLVTMVKAKGNEFELIIENLKTIVNSTIEILKQTDSSDLKDGYLLNLIYSASPLIDNIDETLGLFNNTSILKNSLASFAQLVYLFKSDDQKFDQDEMDSVKKCFEDILSEDDDYYSENDDYYKGRVFTGIYSIVCNHVSAPEVKKWLFEPKEKSKSIINLSYKNSPFIRLNFRIWNHYFFALTEIFEGNFDEALIKVNQINDITWRESALSVLIVETYCKGDINTSKHLLQTLTRPEYIEESCNNIAKSMIHKTNYLLSYSVLPEGIWKKTENIGIFWGESQNNLNSLLQFEKFINAITSSLAPLFNAWNFEIQLAKFVVFKSQRDGKALKKLNEAYVNKLKILNN